MEKVMQQDLAHSYSVDVGLEARMPLPEDRHCVVRRTNNYLL